MVVRRRGVAHQKRRFAVTPDEDVDASIVVVVADRQSPSGKRFGKYRTCLRADVPEAPTVVMEEQQRLLVADILRTKRDHVVWMAVGEQEIDASIVVHIEELESPSAQ